MSSSVRWRSNSGITGMRSVASTRSGMLTEPLIDLHAHLLPGLDDGAADDEAAVAMAAAFAAAGVGTIAATPHLRHDFPTVRPEEIGGRVQALRERLAPAGGGTEGVARGGGDGGGGQQGARQRRRRRAYS